MIVAPAYAAGGRLAVVGNDETSCAYSAVPPVNPFLCGSATRLWLTHDDGTAVRTFAFCPRSFTGDPCKLSQPALSPDGGQLAIGRDDHLLLFDVRNGTSRTVPAPAPTNGDNPAWSPDGRRIATIGQDGIYVVRPDGSGLLRISSAAASFPQWFRSGGHLQLAYVLQGNLAVTDATGSRPRLLTRSGAVGNFTVNARGRFVYVDRTPIYTSEHVLAGQRLLTVDARSPHPHKLAGTPNGDASTFSPASPEFSPDGRHLLYTNGTRTGQDIVVQDWPLGKHRVVIRNDVASNVVQASATWSPDGRRIIIAQARTLSLVRATGGHPAPVLDGTQSPSIRGGLFDPSTDPTGAGSNGYDLPSVSWSQPNHSSTTG